MCGGFTCSKNALTALNILYIVVAFVLIGVAVYGRASALITNLPIIGGILACGIFLILVSILGLIGAVKHHQVILFFYMIILFLLFLIQFSIACACLAVSSTQQNALAKEGWSGVGVSLKEQVQDTFHCCGFEDNTNSTLSNNSTGMGHPVCKLDKYCCSDDRPDQTNCTCQPCATKLQSTISYAFRLCGGIGLFFSFTEILAVLVAYRYRNLHDPFEKLPAAIIPRNYLY